MIGAKSAFSFQTKRIGVRVLRRSRKSTNQPSFDKHHQNLGNPMQIVDIIEEFSARIEKSVVKTEKSNTCYLGM